MILGLLILLVAVIISVVSAYYSILGLTAIFAGAFWAVVLMAGVLEAGKVMATVWLHRNWHRAPVMYKVYLVPAVFFLMLLTSMGVFGFLSKAHLEQSAPQGNISAQVAIFDEKIQSKRDEIETSRRAIAQLDAQIDEILARSTNTRGAERAVTIRRQQANERQQLQADIQNAQAEIVTLSQQREEVAGQLREVEAKIGPIKYIAAMIYGDQTNDALVEQAIRWVIVLIVIVFDPLAIVLILAATRQLDWAKQDKEKELVKKNKEQEILFIDQSDKIAQYQKELSDLKHEIASSQQMIDSLVFDNEQLQQQVHSHNIQPNEPIVVEKVVEVPVEKIIEKIIEIEKYPDDSEIRAYQSQKELEIQELTKKVQSLEIALQKSAKKSEEYLSQIEDMRSNSNNRSVVYSFGAKFPDYPNPGDRHLKTSDRPFSAWMWNGVGWISVSRSSMEGLIHDSDYLSYLMAQIHQGDLDIDDLTDVEIDVIENELKKISQKGE